MKNMEVCGKHGIAYQDKGGFCTKCNEEWLKIHITTQHNELTIVPIEGCECVLCKLLKGYINNIEEVK